MPTWDQMNQQQGPHSGFVDVEGLSEAMANMDRPDQSALPASKFENEWTMPREPPAAQQPGVPAAMFNDEHRVASPHHQSQASLQQGEQGWGGAARGFLGQLF